MKKLFRVYFEQVNQTRYTVVAEDREKAVAKAKKLWVEEYSRPTLRAVEVSADKVEKFDEV